MLSLTPEELRVAAVISSVTRADALPPFTGMILEVNGPENTTVSPAIGALLELNVVRLQALAKLVPFALPAPD
jgi:hypothetical protein